MWPPHTKSRDSFAPFPRKKANKREWHTNTLKGGPTSLALHSISPVVEDKPMLLTMLVTFSLSILLLALRSSTPTPTLGGENSIGFIRPWSLVASFIPVIFSVLLWHAVDASGHGIQLITYLPGLHNCIWCRCCGFESHYPNSLYIPCVYYALTHTIWTHYLLTLRALNPRSSNGARYTRLLYPLLRLLLCYCS